MEMYLTKKFVILLFTRHSFRLDWSIDFVRYAQYTKFTKCSIIFQSQLDCILSHIIYNLPLYSKKHTNITQLARNLYYFSTDSNK